MVCGEHAEDIRASDRFDFSVDFVSNSRSEWFQIFGRKSKGMVKTSLDFVTKGW
jgi:hypothetical protein